MINGTEMFKHWKQLLTSAATQPLYTRRVLSASISSHHLYKHICRTTFCVYGGWKSDRPDSTNCDAQNWIKASNFTAGSSVHFHKFFDQQCLQIYSWKTRIRKHNTPLEYYSNYMVSEVLPRKTGTKHFYEKHGLKVWYRLTNMTCVYRGYEQNKDDTSRRGFA